MGHEFSGVITEVGAGVTGWAEGDRVAVEPIYKCDHCGPCRAGNYNVCQQIGFHGLMSDGGMAEFTVVPTSMLHKLPDNVSLELGALVEPMSVAYHAATLGDVDPRRHRDGVRRGPDRHRAVVRVARARDLTMCSSSSRRRRGAPPSRPSARTTLDPTNLDVPSFIADHTKGDGADAVFDAAGVAPAVSTALACVGSRKPMVSVAIYEKPLETPLLNLVMNESRIQGSLCYTGADFEAVIASDGEGQLRHHRLGRQDRPSTTSSTKGFEALHAGKKMKVLVDPTV